MSAYANEPSRSRALTIDAGMNSAGVFDIDAYHAMDQRDNALIREEIINGVGSSKFVYQFSLGGKMTTGISVIGARHLAAHYGGLKHKLISSVTKTGSLFKFTTYPQAGVPMHVSAQIIRELADEDDFYEVLIEIDDIKRGNTIQVRARETATEQKRDGTTFSRPHYDKIADAKALRNGYLSLIPQDVQIVWKAKMLELNKDEITDSILEEKRGAIRRFAASKSIGIERRNLEALTFDQLSGLGAAARAGGVEEFRKAADVLNVLTRRNVVEQTNLPPPPTPSAKQEPPPAKQEPPAAPKESTLREPDTTKRLELWLAYENGEIASSHPYASAGAFFDAALKLITTETVDVVLENNADAIADAAQADATAHRAFEAAVKAFQAPPADPLALDMPMKGTVKDLKGYVDAARDAIGKLTDRASIEAWSRANDATVAALPIVTKKAVQAAVAARIAAIEAPPAAHEAEPRTEQSSRSVLDDLLADIRGSRTLSEFESMMQVRAVTLRLERLSEDQQVEFRQAVKAHQDALRARIST